MVGVLAGVLLERALAVRAAEVVALPLEFGRVARAVDLDGHVADRIDGLRGWTGCGLLRAGCLRELPRAPLLHDIRMAQNEPTWPEWLAAAGAPEVDTGKGPQFSNSYLAIEAALSGRGAMSVVRSIDTG